MLEASGFKTITIRSCVKNPIQRTICYLQRRSGARIMICFVFARHFFLKNNGLSFVVCVREAFFFEKSRFSDFQVIKKA